MTFKTSRESYDNPEGAKNHLEFLESEDGQLFQQFLGEIFLGRLGQNPDQKILDAGCGNGWLTAKLANSFKNIEGLDGSQPFLADARARYPDLKFVEADLNSLLPYSNNEFDTIIMSLSAGDIEDQSKTFTEMLRILKPSGKFMLAIVNPYYGYPVGTWKRGILGRLLGRKPKLRVNPYHFFAHSDRQYTFNKTVQTNFYRLSEYFNTLRATGFKFEFMDELGSEQDSSQYNIQFRLHRFPIILYLEFSKPA